MHTFIATASGLLLLGIVIVVGRRLNQEPFAIMFVFASVWLIARFIHGALGIAAGQSLSTELLVGGVVFFIPIFMMGWYYHS